MYHLSSRIGFPVDNSSYRFKLSGRSYRVGAAGVRTLSLLNEIYDSGCQRPDVTWLLRLRTQVREIKYCNATAVLSLVVERTDNDAIRLLAIWLRGRCRGSIGKSSVAAFSTHPDDQTRKTVARALHRMGAWGVLRVMAKHDPNPRIRRLATDHAARPFPSRMSHFLKNFHDEQVDDAERGLLVRAEPGIFVRAGLDLRQGRKPKSRAFIRMILERIHRIVAGHPG